MMPKVLSKIPSCFVVSTALLSTVFAMGCFASAPPPPPAPTIAPYQPNFTYKVAEKGKSVDVTLGIIKPQFEAGSQLYREHYSDDEVVKGMLAAMQSSLRELLISKGFTTRGPFVELKKMTYPDKEGSDLVIYPNVNFQVSVKATNMRSVPAGEDTASGGKTSGGFSFASLLKTDQKAGKGAGAAGAAPTVMACDAVVSVVGDVSIVVVEPITGETYLNQVVEVARAKETFGGQQGALCSGGAGSQDQATWTQELKNAWAHAHEAIFQATMKAMDDYINPKELQTIKAKSKETRALKRF